MAWYNNDEDSQSLDNRFPQFGAEHSTLSNAAYEFIKGGKTHTSRLNVRAPIFVPRWLRNSASTIDCVNWVIEVNRQRSHCAICMDQIPQNLPALRCISCARAAHISCKMNWSLSQLQRQLLWSCYQCEASNEFYCYCGKTRVSWPSTIGQCGNYCGRMQRCPHPCRQRCHPGRCPPCQVNFTSTTAPKPTIFSQKFHFRISIRFRRLYHRDAIAAKRQACSNAMRGTNSDAIDSAVKC